MQSIFRTTIWWDDTTSSNSLIGGPITNNWVISSGSIFCYFWNSKYLEINFNCVSELSQGLSLVCKKYVELWLILQMILPRGLPQFQTILRIAPNCVIGSLILDQLYNNVFLSIQAQIMALQKSNQSLFLIWLQ